MKNGSRGEKGAFVKIEHELWIHQYTAVDNAAAITAVYEREIAWIDCRITILCAWRRTQTHSLTHTQRCVQYVMCTSSERRLEPTSAAIFWLLMATTGKNPALSPLIQQYNLGFHYQQSPSPMTMSWSVMISGGTQCTIFGEVCPQLTLILSNGSINYRLESISEVDNFATITFSFAWTTKWVMQFGRLLSAFTIWGRY